MPGSSRRPIDRVGFVDYQRLLNFERGGLLSSYEHAGEMKRRLHHHELPDTETRYPFDALFGQRGTAVMLRLLRLSGTGKTTLSTDRP